MTFTRRGSTRRTNPRRNLAAPTPPASVVMLTLRRSDRPRPIGSPLSVKLSVKGIALDGDPSHLGGFALDQVDRHELAGAAAGLGGEAVLHPGAGKVVGVGLEP